MPRTPTVIPPRVPKRYGTRYPWDKWFAKNSFTLTWGKEFRVTMRGMTNMIRNRGSERGLSLHVDPNEDTKTIRVTVKSRGAR